jgi:hypothetical protein
MVRTTEHTCKDCNKIYASYQSLCNHRTKNHKNVNNSISQHDNSIEQHITAIEYVDFNCRYCNKSYKHQQSRSRHEIICKKTKNIENNNSQIIENNGTINNTTNNITNNTTNNGTINNIVINSYGNENVLYVSDIFMEKLLSNLAENTDESLKNFIPLLIENIHNNPNHKENNNIQFNSLKSPIGKVYQNNKWTYKDKEHIIEELHNDKVEFTEKWINENKEKAPTLSKERLKDYKRISKYYKKKNIYPEINKRGYLYTKNYIENELDS